MALRADDNAGGQRGPTVQQQPARHVAGEPESKGRRYLQGGQMVQLSEPDQRDARARGRARSAVSASSAGACRDHLADHQRSEERRVGKEQRSWLWPYNNRNTEG